MLGDICPFAFEKYTFSKAMVHIPVLLTHNAFLEANSFSPRLKVWIANNTMYRLASTTGPPLYPTLSTHTFTHTAHHMNTDSAGVTDITSVTWLPGGPYTRKLAWWAAGAPLCSARMRAPSLTGDLLLQTGDFPVHFISALHVLCSDPAARKNPGWQVYTKV